MTDEKKGMFCSQTFSERLKNYRLFKAVLNALIIQIHDYPFGGNVPSSLQRLPSLQLSCRTLLYGSFFLSCRLKGFYQIILYQSGGVVFSIRIGPKVLMSFFFSNSSVEGNHRVTLKLLFLCII